MATIDTATTALSDAAFARLLGDRYGLQISRQAISKANYIPRNAAGKVIVEDAILRLAERGRISIDAELALQPPTPSDAPEAAPASPTGRPRAGGDLYAEQAETEKLRRRKLQLEIDEKEGRSLDITDVADAMASASRRIGERIERLALLADELAAAARTSGAQGIRDVLKREARGLREFLAEALRLSAEVDADDADTNRKPTEIAAE